MSGHRAEYKRLGRSPEPAEFSAADYLQMASLGRRTLRIQVGDLGSIDLVEGELWQAQDGHGTGFEALMRLLMNGGLSGEALARCYVHERQGLRQIEIEPAAALLEAARRCDEAQLREAPASLNGTSRSAEGEQLAEQGVEALLARDYGAAAGFFRRAQKLGSVSALVCSNLQRLEELGYRGKDGSACPENEE